MEESSERDRRLVPLSESRCVELLRSAHVGRLAWQSVDGLQILPVSYAYHQGAVVFRTSPTGSLAQLVEPTEVALEVDDLDQTHRTGWSVVVHGQAQAIDEPQDLVDAWTVDGVAPWASGVRNLFLRITPTRITGRGLESQWG
jgi:nitroimidazol reductase NimA-like FMN-containing flavoprotein (pyridoxamine 5'-phosphate oxidase superfamily)